MSPSLSRKLSIPAAVALTLALQFSDIATSANGPNEPMLPYPQMLPYSGRPAAQACQDFVNTTLLARAQADYKGVRLENECYKLSDKIASRVAHIVTLAFDEARRQYAEHPECDAYGRSIQGAVQKAYTEGYAVRYSGCGPHGTVPGVLGGIF